jgi:hypothetical protein
VKDGAGGAGPVMKEGPEAFGHGENELAHRYVRNDVVHQVTPHRPPDAINQEEQNGPLVPLPLGPPPLPPPPA